MKSLVIIPAYNEEKNIVSVIQELEKDCPEVDYIVINDCSTDQTSEILKSSCYTHINLPVNLGIGGGVQTGYKYALQNGYDIAIQFDGDGQHIAKYITDLVTPIENGEADIVIGSRFLKNDGFQSSWQRRTGILLLSKLIKILSKAQVKDVTSGFRAVNEKYIRLYAEEYAQDYPEPEALMHAAILGAKIVEIPVIMRERKSGESSIKSWKSMYYMVKVSLAIVLHRLTIDQKGSKQ